MMPFVLLAQDEREQIKKYYDTAFQYYIEGKYSKAIENWNLILKIDPNQVTAKNMIQQAREKMTDWSQKEKELEELIWKADYQNALTLTEQLIASDETNPSFLRTKKKLENIINIVGPEQIRKNKSWDIARLSLYNYAGKDENLPFAYDAIRYAIELSPKNETFQKILELFEKENPSLKTKDHKTPDTSIIEYKRNLSLQYIYNSQFYPAIKEIEEILQLEPKDVVSLKRLGSVYLKLKKYQQARKVWDKALKISPDDAQLKEYIKALDSIKDSPK